MGEHLTIQQLAEEDRPRERAMANGVASLSNSELIAILLGSGTRQQTAIDVARGLLKKYDDRIDLLCRANLNELMQSNGIGIARAIVVMAALELGKRRMSEERKIENPVVNRSEIAYKHLQPYMGDLTDEHVYVMLLDSACHIIKVVKMAAGMQDMVLFDVRKITKLALDFNAVRVIVAHNHPSGSTRPSKADGQVTEQLHDALKLFGINLFDHLIVCAHDYYSFADEGQI